MDDILPEAQQCQLINTVCDAANASFARAHGVGALATSAQIKTATSEGISMAFTMLESLGAVDFHQRFDDLTSQHVERVKVRVRTQKRDAERRAKSVLKLRATAAASAEREERARKARPVRTILLLSMLLLIAALGFGSR